MVLLAMMSVVSSGLYIYYATVGKDKVPSAVTSTYVTTMTDPSTGEVKPALEANYYCNKNGNGYEVIELRINAYSGVSKKGIYSRGFQIVWDKEGNLIQYTDPTTNKTSDIWYYDSFDNVSFLTGHEYEFGDKMVIDIDGDTYGVALDGKYTKEHSEADGWKIARTVCFMGLNLLFENTDFENKWTTTHEYTFKDLLIKIKEIIKSSSNGTGDGYIPLVDLGNFLHIYEYDEQFKPEPVGGNTANNLINSYFTVSTHYDNRGMVTNKQSLFGSVAGNSEFNIGGIVENVNYWQVRTDLTLTEQDFNARYLMSENGYYYSLPVEKIKELSDYKNTNINIVFDISKFKDLNVLGFDYYALYGIKVNSLTIKCNSQRDFKLLVGSLKETGLKSIITENVKIINVNSGVSL